MRTKLNRHDLCIYTLLLALGGLQLALSGRTSDFTYDSYYYELARSILAGTGYGFNFRPEPMVPPGFPALLALLIVAVGHSYAILIRSMAFFTTLGLIATYEVLKSRESRTVASIICLLLASSPSVFEFSTRLLFSDVPYFFFSMFFVWAVARLDAAANQAWVQALRWWILCVLLMLASILLRSTGVALAGGIFGWLVVSLFREPKSGKGRIAIFIPIVVVGLTAQATWMFWAQQHPVSQWPVHGFQESYVAQLKLKNGNDPELGMATWQDVLRRPLENGDDMAASMVTLFTHKQIAAAQYSPGSVIPLALLLIGLAYSFGRTGGEITEWYFVAYQCLFLFWPWNFELRFQLPVAPLAALYIWRGARLLWRWTTTRPCRVAISGTTLAALGIVSSVAWGLHIRHPSAIAGIAIWSLVGGSFVAILVGGQDLIEKVSVLLEHVVSVGRIPMSVAEMCRAVAVTCLLVAGIWMQTATGLENLRTVPQMNPNVEAAQWIRWHSTADTVVMARWEALVYHYSRRRIIWFPASTDPSLLMAGIRRYNIRLIVITENEDDSYWRPSDGDCFRVLMCNYPKLFHQVHQGAHEQIFEYSPSGGAPGIS